MSNDTVEKTAPATEATPEGPKPGEAEFPAFDAHLTSIAEVAKKDGIEAAEDKGLQETAVELYQAIPSAARAFRNRAKTRVIEAMTEAVGDSNDLESMRLARVYLDISKAIGNLAPAKSPAATKEPVDPSVAWIEGYVVYQLAQQIYSSTPPEGIEYQEALTKGDTRLDDLQEDARKLVTWLIDKNEDKGEAPDVDPLVSAAWKLASGKPTKARKASSTSSPRAPYEGVRRRIHVHMQQAFDASGDEFLSVNQLAKFESQEYAGGNPPSQGAINARIDKALERDSKKIDENLELYAVIQDNVKGVTTVAPQ